MTEPAPLLLISRPADGVALVQLNRPEVRNAMNLALRHALAAAFRAITADPEIRAVVLTGDDRAFCAGADLNEYVDADAAELLARDLPTLWGAIADCPKPIVAAVRGAAIGGGCELALHADIIVAGRSAKFGQPEVRLGIIPGGGGTQRLTRVVGKHVAMRMMLTGAPFGAEEAAKLGIVSTLVADDEVLPEALRLATDIAALPPLAVRHVKQLVLEAQSSPLDVGLRSEHKSFQLMFATPEKTARMRAFLAAKKY
ncbi:enoyl-CoA hydratase [Siculibacillus lacustris]|uniref:Enoyl-CoA hydratase n=1 Tax=Siculibacillus lacustris TaxID=1549641 RepID=A0A4Q9VWH0_9HYPH|nr:enoyl-CoA hydratase-related protein [Siculibacillus lacustris]TBW40670.1 enoyl-CoA hydratase [Siculibacillus lacustris]